MSVGGVEFSATKRIDGGDSSEAETTTLVARGKSHFSAYFLSVCSSVLYLPPEAKTNDAVLFPDNNDAIDAPVALEIHYHMPSRAADFRWATRHFIEKKLKSGEKYDCIPSDIRRSLSQYNDLYRSVKPGDRYLLSYYPGNGMLLSLNGELLGVAGRDLQPGRRQELARTIYSVWFGREAPFSESMRDELLTPLECPVEVPTPASNDAKNSRLSFTVNIGTHKQSMATALTHEIPRKVRNQTLQKEEATFRDNHYRFWEASFM